MEIPEEYLNLLTDEEKYDEYILNKLKDWIEDYDYVEWEEFKDRWFYCERCKGYSEGSCICYAR